MLVRGSLLSGVLLGAALMIGVSHGQSGEPVAAEDMEGHCRTEAAKAYDVTTAYIQIERPESGDDGTVISGKADQGGGLEKDFVCQFDAAGRFVGVEDG